MIIVEMVGVSLEDFLVVNCQVVVANSVVGTVLESNQLIFQIYRGQGIS